MMEFYGKHFFIDLNQSCIYCGNKYSNYYNLIKNNYQKEYCVFFGLFKERRIMASDYMLRLIDEKYPCEPLTKEEWIIKDIIE